MANLSGPAGVAALGAPQPANTGGRGGQPPAGISTRTGKACRNSARVGRQPEGQSSSIGTSACWWSGRRILTHPTAATRPQDGQVCHVVRSVIWRFPRVVVLAPRESCATAGVDEASVTGGSSVFQGHPALVAAVGAPPDVPVTMPGRARSRGCLNR